MMCDVFVRLGTICILQTFGIADEPFGTAEVLLQQVLKRLVTKGGFTWNDYSSERQIESKEKVFLHKQLIVTRRGENLSRHPSLVMALNYSANLKIKCNDSWLNRTMKYLQRCNFIFSWCDCRNRRHGKIAGLTRITTRLIYTQEAGRCGRSWVNGNGTGSSTDECTEYGNHSYLKSSHDSSMESFCFLKFHRYSGIQRSKLEGGGGVLKYVACCCLQKWTAQWTDKKWNYSAKGS